MDYKKFERRDAPFWSLKSMRFYIAFLLMFVIFCSVIMRDNLGIAMVCMVNSTAYAKSDEIFGNNSSHISNQHENRQCKNLEKSINLNVSSSNYEGTFLWTPTMQGFLFSALSYGSSFTILFSGYLADLYGPRRVAMLALIVYFSLTLLSPLLAEVHFYAFLISRGVMGLAEGCIFPSVAALSSRWIPAMERSTVAAIYTSGYQLGNGLGVLIGSRLCSIRFLGGWPLIFYFSGIISITCLILWYFMATNTPSESKLVSNKEKRFLESELKDVPSNSRANKKKLNIPWVQMFTSPALMAIVVARFSYECQMVIMQSFLPSYFRDVLNLDIETNGFYAAIPFASLLIAKNIIAIVSDKLKQAGVMSMTTSCKIWQSFAAFGTSIVLVCMALFLDCTKPGLALIILILYGIFFAGCMPGSFTAMLSLAPAFTGTIASIGSSATVSAKILTPTIIGFVNLTGTRNEWAIIFYMASVLNIIAGIFFLIFGSAEVQSWARLPKQSNDKVAPEITETKDEVIKKW